MANLTVDIAGSSYHLACADEDEDRLGILASYVNERATELKNKLGHVTENRLLVMTALIIADELRDTIEGKSEGKTFGGYSDEDLSAILEQIAVEVEEVADRAATP